MRQLVSESAGPVRPIIARLSILIFLLWLLPEPSLGQKNVTSSPVDVPLCDLLGHPQALSKQTVRTRGVVRLESENFTLYSRACRWLKPAWLMFGGDVATPTPSTRNDTVRKAGTVLRVDGVPYPLLKDTAYREFHRAITERYEQRAAYSVSATLEGTFFAAPVKKDARGKEYPAGYGHLWCCHLLIIGAVSGVEAIPVHPYIDGTVLTSSSSPLSGIEVQSYSEHFGISDGKATSTTDDRGHVRLSRHGEILSFRNSGYRPASVVVEPGDENISVTLEKSERTDWVASTCPPPLARPAWVGMDSSLALPAGARIKKQKTNDYLNGRSKGTYIVKSRYEPYALSVASVAQETNGDLLDFYLVRSIKFDERWVKDRDGHVIGLDTRGQLPAGLAWRRTTFGHDVVSYLRVPTEAAGFFDQIIDSACSPTIKAF
jgi:hypothetical protein